MSRMTVIHFNSSPHLQSMLTVGKLCVRGLPRLTLGVRQPFRNFNASMAAEPLHQKCVSSKSSRTQADGCGVQWHTKSFLGISKRSIGLSEFLQDFPSQQKVSWKLKDITLLWLTSVGASLPSWNAFSQTSPLSFQRSFSQQSPPSKPVLTLFTKVRFIICLNQSHMACLGLLPPLWWRPGRTWWSQSCQSIQLLEPTKICSVFVCLGDPWNNWHRGRW